MTTIQAGTAAIRPAIISVTDASNTPIPNGGSTADTSVSLSGTAEANSVVVIYDGPAFKGSASVVSAGTWAMSISDLAAETHRFTARTPDGTLISDEWVITVGASLDLIAPTVVGATGGVLDPMQAIAGAKVVVAYAGMNTTDSIALSWNGQLDITPPQYGSNLGSVTFDIPAWAVGAVIGKTINVLYVVARNGVSTLSDTLMLQVAKLPESALEAPKIAQAPDDQNLDVSVLTADADLSVKPWPFINAGQRISLRFEGTKADGTPYNWSHPTWQDLPISSTAMPSTTVELSHLEALKNGSGLNLIFEVSFDGGATKISFPHRTLVVATITLPAHYEDFESESTRYLPAGYTYTFPSGLGLTTSASASYIFEVMDASGNLQKALKGSTIIMTMTFSGDYNKNLRISVMGSRFDPETNMPITIYSRDYPAIKTRLVGPVFSFSAHEFFKVVIGEALPGQAFFYDIGWD